MAHVRASFEVLAGGTGGGGVGAESMVTLWANLAGRVKRGLRPIQALGKGISLHLPRATYRYHYLATLRWATGHGMQK